MAPTDDPKEEPPYRFMIPLPREEQRLPPTPEACSRDLSKLLYHVYSGLPIFSRDMLQNIARQLECILRFPLNPQAPGGGPVVHIPDLRRDMVRWELETGAVTGGNNSGEPHLQYCGIANLMRPGNIQNSPRIAMCPIRVAYSTQPILESWLGPSAAQEATAKETFKNGVGAWQRTRACKHLQFLFRGRRMPKITKIVAIGLSPIMRQPTHEMFVGPTKRHALIIAIRDVLLRCGHGYKKDQELPPSLYDQIKRGPPGPHGGGSEGDLPANSRSPSPDGTEDPTNTPGLPTVISLWRERLYSQPVVDGPISPQAATPSSNSNDNAANSATSANDNNAQGDQARQNDSQGRMNCFVQNPLYSESDERFLAAVGITVVPDPWGFLEIDDTTLVISLDPLLPVREIVSDIAMPAVFLCNTATWPQRDVGIREWINSQQ
ncbi:hypothetical protein B0J18DRAFT_458088 [Chaetomium sp. MPI-SDFR-AT-0129]|nr:hypothetical protein B0J18DRAFT_458088 [Chaetomium sp. MPI-SDFR-AT-0129]